MIDSDRFLKIAGIIILGLSLGYFFFGAAIFPTSNNHQREHCLEFTEPHIIVIKRTPNGEETEEEIIFVEDFSGAEWE